MNRSKIETLDHLLLTMSALGLVTKENVDDVHGKFKEWKRRHISYENYLIRCREIDSYNDGKNQQNAFRPKSYQKISGNSKFVNRKLL